jgi:formylglycine-generating enzyme required for sulfatase activity
MKIRELSLLIFSICLLNYGALGQVPELVNYQGRLLDDGAPVNGNVSVAVCIYSNDMDSALVYTEVVGDVPVINGLYSFRFGAGGSVTEQATELVAVTDGVALSFSTTVTNPPMQLGSVSVGTVSYSWDEVSGSSHPSEFTVTVNHASGLVNVFYLLGPPTGGNGIAVTYEYSVESDFGTALANPEAWLEVKIDDEPLSPRQRLIAVPYARNSKNTEALGSVLAETESPKAGAIRWNGSRFEGYNGIGWVALSGSIQLTPEMVTVGDPGNSDDPEDNGFSSADKNSGAVAYIYKIGKYEVTNTEYTKFLNAVDPSGVNRLNLFNANNFGILENASGAIGSKYVPLDRSENAAVNFVSLYDAMRYCNWLHNGAVQGGDTEDGAYTLLGGNASPQNGLTVLRNAGAKYAVPTEDEWYKAAYYEPGGDTDDYWLYPTRGNSPPAADFAPGVAPSASYNNKYTGASRVGQFTTTIGYYGTFDMAGNVHEWIESFDGAGRILRGGGWSDVAGILRSSNKSSVGPGTEFDFVGFRIVSP